MAQVKHASVPRLYTNYEMDFPTCAGADGVAADQGGPGGGAADGEAHLRSLSCLIGKAA